MFFLLFVFFFLFFFFFLGAIGPEWVRMGATGTYWVPMGASRGYWGLVGIILLILFRQSLNKSSLRSLLPVPFACFRPSIPPILAFIQKRSDDAE